jgi:hypothetical protein
MSQEQQEDKKNLYWVLFSEHIQAPVIRKHIRAKSVTDAKLLLLNTFPAAVIMRMGELTDVEPDQKE